jgi:hypothetical protein
VTEPANESPPLGPVFVLQRLSELTDADSRWWSKGTGLGAKLRIQELLQLSEAQRGGDIYASSVDRLRKQARSTLGQANEFLGSRYGPLRELLVEALSGSAKKIEEAGLGSLWPGSGSYSSLTAGLEFLEGTAYLEAISAEITEKAQGAADVNDLWKLNDLVELLDAELVSDGHSRRWRVHAYGHVNSAVQDGSSLEEALTTILGERRKEREFHVIAVLEAMSEPTHVEVQIQQASEEELFQTISAWESEPPEEALTFPIGGLIERVSAVDEFAAAEAAAEQFGKRKALWCLQGGELEIKREFLVYDGVRKRANVVRVDAELNLRPENLRRVRLQTAPPRLVDGLLQLAEARKSPAGAMLADLWGVAEVCFSGIAVGPRDQAGSVMAGILQYLYITDYLDWLGERFISLGVEPALGEGQGRPDWALETIARHSGNLFPRLREHDVLAWARAKQVARWDEDRFLERDLDAVRAKIEATTARAYLMRNFFIHAGKTDRSAALAVTLPAFAELLRLSLGFVLESEAEPSVSARLAMLRARQLAFDYRNGNADGPGALADAVGLPWRQES